MLVPTIDTVRYGFLLEKLLDVDHSVLFTGVTGVGKVSDVVIIPHIITYTYYDV